MSMVEESLQVTLGLARGGGGEGGGEETGKPPPLPQDAAGSEGKGEGGNCSVERERTCRQQARLRVAACTCLRP